MPVRISSLSLSLVFLFGFWFSVFGIGCSADPSEPATYDPTPYVLNTYDLPPAPLPPDVQLTKAKVQLGRMLFYDGRLSKDGSQSCASCHIQADGFSDKRRFSIGVEGKPGTRQAMTIANMAWHRDGFFWDGRAPRLRDQALRPIQDPLEMNETLENVEKKLRESSTYRDQFTRAFGNDSVTSERISLALEQFMFTIISGRSKFDSVLAEKATFTAAEQRGHDLFFREFDPITNTVGGECFHCHGGPNFTNDRYMNNGLDTDDEFTDGGRFQVTNNPRDRAKFKTPSLRNIALTAPYMHDGRFTTLEEVVRHYNTGVKQSSTVEFLLQYNLQPGGLRMTDQDVQDIVAFLHTLTDHEYVREQEYARP